MLKKILIRELNHDLNKIAEETNLLLPECDIKFWVGSHFVERLIRRSSDNPYRAVGKVIEAVRRNICQIVYYRHLGTALPNRGSITVEGNFEIRGYIQDNRYVLATYVEVGVYD